MNKPQWPLSDCEGQEKFPAVVWKSMEDDSDTYKSYKSFYWYTVLLYFTIFFRSFKMQKKPYNDLKYRNVDKMYFLKGTAELSL